MKKMLLLWCDLETTGLDPRTGHILEVALTLTTEDLDYIVSYEAVIKPPEPITVDLIVAEMHAKNGLFSELRDGKSVQEVQAEMVKWLDKQLKDINSEGEYPEPPTLAGNTITFDRWFLLHHMPSFERKLHYRNFDVSTLLAAHRMWLADVPKGQEAHRARADVDESLETARKFKILFERLLIIQSSRNDEPVFGVR